MAFYDAIPASDGTSTSAFVTAEFKVYEVSDTARANPLPLRTVAGTNAAPLLTTAQGVVPPVEVDSPNFEHIFKSGEWEWRRESSEGIKRAALSAQAAAEEAARNTQAPTLEAVAAALVTDGPAKATIDAAIDGAVNLKLDKAEAEERFGSLESTTETIAAASDPLTYLDSVALLCEFPVRENGETLWPQGVSINKAANELYVSNQSGTHLRIDVRNLTTGERKSFRSITTEDQCWTEGLPWFYNGNNELCFIIRATGGTPTQSASYALYNYTTNSKGANIPIKGGVRSDVDGDYFVTTDAWTRTVSNFYVYDWASVRAGTPTLLATIPAHGGIATAAKNQGLAYVGGYFYLIQGDQSESPTYMAWDSNGKLMASRQFSRAAFKDLVNKLRPGRLTNNAYIYEAEGGCNVDGKLVSVQIVNNNPAVTADGVVLILQHNRIDGVRGQMQPVNTFVYDTGWLPLTLINGFTAAYGPSPAVRRIGNEVIFRGHVVKNATTNYEACATLPSALWPKKTETFPGTANTTAVLNTRVSDATGGVEMYSSATTAAWRSLSGIRYFLD